VRAPARPGQVKLTIAGSGDVDLAPLAADEVVVSIAGSGDARVTANKSLGVTIAGSGDVVYGGQRHRRPHLGGRQRPGVTAIDPANRGRVGQSTRCSL
jgi:hypothetical protein